MWKGTVVACSGSLQYSQRDPNRDHTHGRIYRLVYKDKPLLKPVTQAGKHIYELLEQLKEYEQLPLGEEILRGALEGQVELKQDAVPAHLPVSCPPLGDDSTQLRYSGRQPARYPSMTAARGGQDR